MNAMEQVNNEEHHTDTANVVGHAASATEEAHSLLLAHPEVEGREAECL